MSSRKPSPKSSRNEKLKPWSPKEKSRRQNRNGLDDEGAFGFAPARKG